MFNTKSNDLSTRLSSALRGASTSQLSIAGAVTGAAALAVGAYAFLRRGKNVKSAQAKAQARNPDGTFKAPA